MTTITRERLEQIYAECEERDPAIFEIRELVRIALASLEAKPIGAFHIADQQVSGTTDYIKDGEWPIDNGVIEVYADPPAPVVPEEITDESTEQRLMGRRWAHSFCAGWNACRAAMLSGGKS